MKSDKMPKKFGSGRYLGRIYGWQNSAHRNFSGGFSANKFPAANSAIGGGWGVYPRLLCDKISISSFEVINSHAPEIKI